MDGPRNPLLFCFVLSFAVFCCCGAAWSAPATTRQKPALKRPVPKRPPVNARTLAPASVQAVAPAKMSVNEITPQAAGTAYSNTPPPSASFEALPSDGSAFNPDTHGAVGPNHLMVTLNSEVRIQDRSGGQISRVSLDAWWAVAGQTAGATNVFDPRVVYDPYGGRFIFSANNDPDGSNPGLLIAVSATSDPTGTWYRRFIDINATRPVFADSPTLGFNRHWIVLSTDTYTNTPPYDFSRADIFVYNKTNFYANGSFAPTSIAYPDAFAIVPVVTYDANLTTNYLVSVIAGVITNYPAGETNGVLGIFAIGGPVTAPTFTDLTYPLSEGLWADSADSNLGPQLGTSNKIFLGDSRITSATWRRGTIQAAHTIFLPANNPTYAAVQWWEFTEDATINLGQIDGGSSGRMYAYPSIAANRNNDLVVGFSRFSTNEYPSAAYAYREDLGDPFNSLRSQVVFKSGNAPYFRTNSSGNNLWGDWSATMIDPLNDTDFWTIQQYAEFPQAGTDRWGTWWARISPPTDLVLTASDAPDPVVAGSNLTYTITVTNLLTATDGGRSASGVRISNSLPAGLTYVSASASQGTCSHSAGVVICDLGTLTNLTRATASIVVKPTVAGPIDNTIAVHANGPDADFTDNMVTVTTTVLPSADLEVLLAESQDPITVGDNLTYTLTVTNNGPAEATLVRLTNNLPASCTFVSVSQSIGNCTNIGSIVSCNLGSLVANANATVMITVRPNTGGITVSNRANVAASSADPSAGNNVRSILTYINSRPTISLFNNQTINEDTSTIPLPFTIGDIETAAGNLQLAINSSMPSIIPEANVVLGGSGASRTATVTPALNQSGTSTITITVTDSEGAATNRVFTVTVNPLNDAPTVTPIASPQVIAEDSATADLPFTIGDVDHPLSALTVAGNSSNLPLVPIANISFGGSGADRTVRVIPVTNQVGSATITVTVNDGAAGGISNMTFVVTVNAVNDRPDITPIADRTVNEDTSTGLIPFNIIDVETSATLTLSAASSDPAIVATNNVVFGGSGTNRTVTILGTTNQHGVVQITITVSDGSLIDTSSFNLTINPVNDVPTLTALSNITTNEDAGEIIVPLTGISSGAANEMQDLTITVSNSNPAVIESYNLNYTSAQPTGTLVLNTATNAVGASTITVTLRDDGTSNNVVTRTFTVTLTAVNDAPVISDIPNQNIDEDTVTSAIPFTISDAENNFLTVAAFSSQPTIVPVPNITFGGTGNNRTVTVRPATNQSGSVTITVAVGDGLVTSSNTFLVTVNPIDDAPVFVTPAADRSFPEDAQASIPFVIGDVETPAANLTVVATDSSNPTLAPLSAISFTGSGSNRTVLITPVMNEVGSSTITLRLNDGAIDLFDTFVLTVTNINDLPRILTPIADQTIAEDTSTAVIPFTIDDEETPGALTVTGGSSNPALVPVANIVFGGAPSVNRTVQVTPAGNQFGSATITVFVSDGGATGSNSFLVTVTPVNDVPIISSIPNVVTNEDFQTVALPFTIRDLETPAANLTLAVSSSNPEVVDDSGIIIGGAATNRTVTIRPLTNQVGSATIFITVTDASNAMATVEFEVEFVEVNDRPSINNIGNVTMNEDTNAVVAFTIDDPETLPENLTVTASSGNQALVPNGNLTLGGSGATRTLMIVPAANQSGTATITLNASDGVATGSNSFVLTVTAVNDAPVISAIADAAANEDTPTVAVAFTVGDLETVAASLTLSAVSSSPTLVPNGNVIFGGAGANRTVLVRPATNQFGFATITVIVSDGNGGSNQSAFEARFFPVNDAPFIVAIPDQTIVEDTASAPIAVNVSDPENAPGDLLLTASSSNTSLIPNAQLVFGGSGGARTLTVTPALNQTGSSTITVTVTDTNGVSVSDSFLVTVTPTNDAPTISQLPDVTISEDTAIGPIPFTVGDLDSATLTLTAGSSNPGLIPVANVVFGGAASNRTVTVTPVANSNGTALITVTVSDGTAMTATTFNVNVVAVNDPPVLNAIANVAIAEDAALQTVNLAGIGSGAANEGQALTVTAVSSNPSLIPNPSVVYTSPQATGSLTFTPVANASGIATITVTVDDGQATNRTFSRTFTVTVNPGNDPPTISNIPNFSTGEDTPASMQFTVGDIDTNVSALTLTASSANTALLANTNILLHGSGTLRTLTVIPTLNQFGTSTVTVTVSDGVATANDTFVLTVIGTNDPPTLDPIPDVYVNQGSATTNITLTGITTGAANETQTLTLSNSFTVDLFQTDPTITYTSPNPTATLSFRTGSGAPGTSVVTVVVREATNINNTTSQSFRVYVKPTANSNAPTISTITNRTTLEDTPINIPFVIADSQTPADLLVVSALSTNVTLLSSNSFAFSGTSSNRTLTITPNTNQSGSATVTVSVTDTNFGGRTSNFVLTVTAVNDLPTISNIPGQTIDEDTSSGPVPFTIGDVETPAGGLTLSALSSNPTLVPVANIRLGGSGADRAVIVTPATNQAGTATISVIVTDGNAGSTTNTFMVTVNPVNDPPTISTIAALNTNEDTPSAAVPFTIGDLETAAGSLNVVADSSNPSLIQSIQLGGSGANRTVAITPNPNAFGAAIVTVTVTDGDSGMTSTSVDVTVTPVNDPPTLDPIGNLSGVGSGLQTVPLLGIQSGAANEAQTLFLAASSSNPGLIPHPTINYTSPNTVGSLAFTPNTNLTGSATITVTVNDGQAQNNTLVRTFTVSVNTPPTLSDITNRIVNEDASSLIVPFTIGDAESGPGSVTLAFTSSNPALVPDNTLTPVGTGPNRGVVVTPLPERSGITLITVIATDPLGAAVSDSFLLTVTSVNDTPTLGGIVNQSVLVNSGPQTVNLSGISAGGNEVQILRLSATSDNPSLIPQPTLSYTSPSSTGVLTFTPVTNAVGSANITVTVMDDGGTANGAQDFVTQTFVVTVSPTTPTRLAIVRSGNMVTVSWPVNAGSFVLQSQDGLAAAWGDVFGSPVISGGQNTVTQTITGGERFYRLRSQ